MAMELHSQSLNAFLRPVYPTALRTERQIEMNAIELDRLELRAIFVLRSRCPDVLVKTVQPIHLARLLSSARRLKRASEFLTGRNSRARRLFERCADRAEASPMTARHEKRNN